MVKMNTGVVRNKIKGSGEPFLSVFSKILCKKILKVEDEKQ